MCIYIHIYLVFNILEFKNNWYLLYVTFTKGEFHYIYNILLYIYIILEIHDKK